MAFGMRNFPLSIVNIGLSKTCLLEFNYTIQRPCILTTIRKVEFIDRKRFLVAVIDQILWLSFFNRQKLPSSSTFPVSSQSFHISVKKLPSPVVHGLASCRTHLFFELARFWRLSTYWVYPTPLDLFTVTIKS